MKSKPYLISTILTGLLLLAAARATLHSAAQVSADPGDVVINEVAWMGTAASSTDEWIELYNTTAAPITLTGWTLAAADGSPTIVLTGSLPAGSYFLLERTGDDTVSDVPADQVYTGSLSNSGEALILTDDGGTTIDTANGDGGAWPAGESAGRRTMERIDPTAAGADGNWATNDGLTRNGLDANGDPIDGTPRSRNSATVDLPTPTPTHDGTPTPTTPTNTPTTPLPTTPAPPTPTSTPTNPEAGVLIAAAYYDGYQTNDRDEAVRLVNTGDAPADLAGWQLCDAASGGSCATLVSGTLAANTTTWLAQSARDFHVSWGFYPDYAARDLTPGVLALSGAWPGYANSGDEVALRDASGDVTDALVYEDGDTLTQGWNGPAVSPYALGGETGQVLYRIPDEVTGLPVADTDTSADWAQVAGDHLSGRRVRYPGWDDFLFWPLTATETASLTVAIAPDATYDLISQAITQATHSIRISSYTLEHARLAQALAGKAAQGVDVTVLLEGEPAGGLQHQERWACWQIETAGGQCWFMHNDAANRVYDRYDHLHAKYLVIDDAWALVGSENLNPTGLPDDDKRDGTAGRRGVYLML